MNDWLARAACTAAGLRPGETTEQSRESPLHLLHSICSRPARKSMRIMGLEEHRSNVGAK